MAGDLRFVEQVTGRRGCGTAAIEGATAGDITGALLGFVLGIFSLVAPLTSRHVLALWGLVLGGVMGALVGVLAHTLSGDRRDYSAGRGFDAGRFDVVAAAAVAERARRTLRQLGTRAAA